MANNHRPSAEELERQAREDLAERQNMPTETRKLRRKLSEHNSESPNLSAEDIDAAWEDSNDSGEESVGGSAPTPDQDIVEELGEAVGLTYADDEPLGFDRKMSARDRARWELLSDSTDDEDGDGENWAWVDDEEEITTQYEEEELD